MPKLSIITVCLNAEKEIDVLIKSILQQTYTDFEYIIKDGKSTDNTKKIIEGYKNDFEKRNIRFKFISQKDQGIYDAINEAVKYVEGEWIHLLTAGTGYYDENVLSDIFEKNNFEDYAVIFGDACVIDGSSKGIWVGDLKKFPKEMSFNIESSFF